MGGFENLIPERFLPVLEEALGMDLTSLIRPFPSYINRVYETQSEEGDFYVAKFYRPDRWNLDALQDEHQFLLDCQNDEIPVVSPLTLKNGKTLDRLDNIPFAVFPKKAGRRFDIENDESWERVGVLLSRLHTTGQKGKAPARINLNPKITTQGYIDSLLADGVTPQKKQGYKDICARVMDAIVPLFGDEPEVRIHGDFHTGNILERPDTGLLVIDFDDMMTGSPAQDFWLLLPDHYPASKKYLDLLFSGYRQFRDVNPKWPGMIEALRAMRMIYFTAWCNVQKKDFQFQNKFPEWGTDNFWNQEIRDLSFQNAKIIEAQTPEF